jgi:hypothetical protein
MGAVYSISRSETRLDEPEPDEASEVTWSHMSLTQDDQTHFDIIQRKVNASSIFRSLNDSLRIMIARDLSIKPKFMRSYFDLCSSYSSMELSLVICEIDKTKNHEGVYHTGLVLGHTIITWNDDSLCVPVKYDKGTTMGSTVLHKFQDESDLQDGLCVIAEKILEWNVCRTYSRTAHNSQHFIDDVCEALELDEPHGQLAEFIDRIRTTGRCNPLFLVSDELARSLDIRKGRIEFHSHAELDQFVAAIDEKGAFISQQERHLLTKYDRVFWLRYNKDRSSSSCTPHDCPFSEHTISDATLRNSPN